LQPIFKTGNDLINKGIQRKSVEIGWTLQPFSAAFNRFATALPQFEDYRINVWQEKSIALDYLDKYPYN